MFVSLYYNMHRVLEHECKHKIVDNSNVEHYVSLADHLFFTLHFIRNDFHKGIQQF